MISKVLVFMLGGHRLALPADVVRECLPLPRLSRRPGMPDAVAGFLRLGHRTLPVLDLARLLGLRGHGVASLLEADGLYRHVIRLDSLNLLVDRALGFADATDMPADELPDAQAALLADPQPGASRDPWQPGCVRHLLAEGEPVALLDPERILHADERARLNAMTEAASRREDAWAGEDVLGDAG